MSAYNQVPVFSVDVASNVTLSDAIDLGRGWENIAIEIPTMTSGTDIYFQCASTLSGTYRRHHNKIATGTADPGAMYITSAITQCFVPLPDLRARFLKIELSTAMTSTAVTFNVVCS